MARVCVSRCSTLSINTLTEPRLESLVTIGSLGLWKFKRRDRYVEHETFICEDSSGAHFCPPLCDHALEIHFTYVNIKVCDLMLRECISHNARLFH